MTDLEEQQKVFTRWAALMNYALGYGSVVIVADSDHVGSVLPQHLKGKVVLNYSLDFVPPIPDLRINVSGILATLSFKGENFVTFIPWGAVDHMEAKGAVPMVTGEQLDEMASRPTVAQLARKVAEPLLTLVPKNAVFIPSPDDITPDPETFTGLELIE